ncbi:MAG TPA: hypothetical protein VGJ53_19415 [Micromonosporaceae bacterium]|jgi:hypothetical protein
MIQGRFTVEVDDLDDLTETIAARVASRVVQLLGGNPDDEDLREAKAPRPRTANDVTDGYPLGGPPGRRVEPDDEL